MSDSIRLPDMNDIANWLDERCQVERTRLRNELAFIQGDRAHGGPPREHLATALKFRLAAIEQRLEGICSRTEADRITTRAAEEHYPCNTDSDFRGRVVAGLEIERGQKTLMSA
jgi:hypothetical protein